MVKASPPNSSMARRNPGGVYAAQQYGNEYGNNVSGSSAYEETPGSQMRAAGGAPGVAAGDFEVGSSLMIFSASMQRWFVGYSYSYLVFS